MGSEPPTNELTDRNKVINVVNIALALIVGFFGTIITIYQFIQIWQGDQATVTWIVAILGAILAIIGIGYVAFSTKIPRKVAHKSNKPIPRYPKYYRVARIILGCFALLVVATLAILYWKGLSLQQKTIVLVADFNGPNEEKYLVTQKILYGLNSAIVGKNDIIITPLKMPLSEYDGDKKAREIGNNYHAAIVLWGYYGVTDSNALITIHVEHLANPELINLPASPSSQINVPKADIDSFQVQEQIATEMESLTLFVSGLALYDSQDFNTAILRFNKVMDIGLSDPAMLKPSQVLFSRGSAYLGLGQEDLSLVDFNTVTQLDSTYSIAYCSQAVIYALKSQYEKALSVCTEAIKLDPNNAALYDSRALIHTIIALDQKTADENSEYLIGLEDSNQAISLDSENSGFYDNRGILYFDLGDKYYGRAEQDFYKSISLNHNSPIPYKWLGKTYINSGECIKAIDALTHAIEIRPSHTAYNDRAVAYSCIGEKDKELEDYNNYFNLLPPDNDPVVYWNRGLLYSDLGQKNNAIADFEKVVQLSQDPTLIKEAKDQLKTLGTNP